MKLVILDGYTTNPGDLDWEPLRKFGELTIHDRTKPEEIFDRANGAEIIFTNKTIIDAEILARLKDLKYIGLFSTGTNVVDLAAAKEYGVIVTNIPAYSTESVAQMTFAHILNLSFAISEHTASVRNGDWVKHIDFCYWYSPLIELNTLTFGSIGYGSIGKAAARIARAFGMKVIACDSKGTERTLEDGTELVKMETVLENGDVVSLHCPLNDSNAKMIDSNRIGLMKKTAFLINTSRGGLIDEPALAEALNSGRIAGAGLDVLSSEPPRTDNPLLCAKNCFITPHIAWGTFAARKRLLEILIANLEAFLSGVPRNIVT